MVATLIPLFDGNMTVKSYSLFTQKTNTFLNPGSMGMARFDGAGRIDGLEVIESLGIETLSEDCDIFVSVNNISLFADIESQCTAPHDRIVILLDRSITPEEMYVNRIKELKSKKYKFAIRKLSIADFEPYKSILSLMDYILLDHKKIKIEQAKIYFSKVYPNISLCAVNIKDMESYDSLVSQGGYEMYEGEFFRMPITKGDTEVSPLKINYIELLNIVNVPDGDYDLTAAADIIGRDTALVISLLKMVNNMVVNKGVKDIRHAAALLGQGELKKWINTAVTNQMCADKPNEITRISLLRAKFAENLAEAFQMGGFASELFLMGLFSVIDIILNKTMAESLELVKVSKKIEDALVNDSGEFAKILDFMRLYESADWQEISRLLIVENIEMDVVYTAYKDALSWYRNVFS